VGEFIHMEKVTINYFDQKEEHLRREKNSQNSRIFYNFDSSNMCEGYQLFCCCLATTMSFWIFILLDVFMV
jgi:hypothetical protein